MNQTCVVRKPFFGRLVFVALIGANSFVSGADWPHWMGPTRDGVWNETGIMERIPADGPKILWKAPVGGGYAGPSVADGKVFVPDFVTTEKAGASDPNRRDLRKGTEQLVCFDAKKGAVLWTYKSPAEYNISYATGPRATPAFYKGKVYFLGAEGKLACLDANDGKVIWSKELKKEYKCESPIWGFSSHPVLEGDQLFVMVGGKNSALVCFDRNTGKEIWKSLDVADVGYAPVTLIGKGKDQQLIAWHSKGIHGLDPATGKVVWSERIECDYGMSVMAPIVLDDLVYAGGMRTKSLALRLDTKRKSVTELWHGEGKTGLHSCCAPPIVIKGVLYGADVNGEFMAVRPDTGERLWTSTKPTTNDRKQGHGSAYVVRNGDRCFLLSEMGDLIVANLSPDGYEELDRAHVIEPTSDAFGRSVLWSHPAFANKCMFARNDKEIICFSLAE